VYESSQEAKDHGGVHVELRDHVLQLLVVGGFPAESFFTQKKTSRSEPRSDLDDLAHHEASISRENKNEAEEVVPGEFSLLFAMLEKSSGLPVTGDPFGLKGEKSARFLKLLNLIPQVRLVGDERCFKFLKPSEVVLCDASENTNKVVEENRIELEGCRHLCFLPAEPSGFPQNPPASIRGANLPNGVQEGMPRPSTQEVIVHSDKRACLTAPLLKSFADAAGLRKLPKRIFVRHDAPFLVLRWTAFKGSRTYALSVRDRVLVAGFLPGTTLVVKKISQQSLTLVEKAHLASSPPKTNPSKRGVPRITHPNKKEPTMSFDLQAVLVQGLCVDLRQNYTSRTLLEVATALERVAPGVTMGDFFNAEGPVLVDFSQVVGTTLTPTAKAPAKKTVTSNKPAAKSKATAATESEKIVTDDAVLSKVFEVLKKHPQGALIHAFTGKKKAKVPFWRNVLSSLIVKGEIHKTGNTRSTRYYRGVSKAPAIKVPGAPVVKATELSEAAA
jgi:hypothetical protein